MEKQNVAYMLRCGDDSLYTGWTNDIEKRLLAHQSGKGGKYTRSRLPVTLVYVESCETKQEAMQREYAIKQLSRASKEKLLVCASNEIELFLQARDE
ncbi:MAG: GIY-YIG nuclease family protein [Lachnospiraceae bacterium]|nr:GIY-YIG nuclease family protein [Lachnospiraceae bacterium]